MVMGKVSSNGWIFRNGHQILACYMILGEALNAALFWHVFSIGKMETRAHTADASINSAGFGQCLYTPVTGAGYFVGRFLICRLHVILAVHRQQGG